MYLSYIGTNNLDQLLLTGAVKVKELRLEFNSDRRNSKVLEVSTSN